MKINNAVIAVLPRQYYTWNNELSETDDKYPSINDL